jgi:hypothetical protein
MAVENALESHSVHLLHTWIRFATALHEGDIINKTCPKIAFVGTHKDLEHECPLESREMKEKSFEA